MLAPLTDELRAKHGIGKDMKGVIVLEVDPASPAAEKGVKVGDVIVEVAQEPSPRSTTSPRASTR